jgi:hypothetical protein
MKYLKLYEQFFLIKEGKSNKCILIDGTSSAGKTYMSEGLIDKGWVIIGSDDFAGESELKIPFDHSVAGYDKEAGEEFHKKMSEEREGKLGERGATNVGFPGHPKNEEFKKSGVEDPRVWYMYQDYLYGRGKDKNVIFDDISDGVLKFIPDCDYILLYTPLEQLKTNVIDRSKKNDKRGEWVFSEQFINRFEATKNKSESFDGDKSYTKKELEDLLEDKKLQESFNEGPLDVNKFLNDLGFKEDDTEYWIKLRNTLPKGEKIFNSRGKTPDDLVSFI